LGRRVQRHRVGLRARSEGPSPDFGVLPGFEASLEALRQYWETFEDFQVEIEEVIHIDEEQVVTPRPRPRAAERKRFRDIESRLSGLDLP
jgi:hypothetical protein